MRDEMDGRLWVEHHESFSKALVSLWEELKIALCKLHKIQFHAPWNPSRSDSC